MAEFADNQESAPLDAVQAPTGSPGWTWAAWLVIAGFVVGFVTLRPQLVPEPAAGGDDRLGRKLVELEYRLLIGATKVLKDSKLGELEPAVPPPKGTVLYRLYHVVLAGEVASPEEALRRLDALDHALRKYQHQPTAEEERLRAVLRRLYQDYARGRLDRPALTAADRAFLVQRLGWFGRLALAPPTTVDSSTLSAAAGCGLALGFTSDRSAVLEPAEDAFQGFAGVAMLLVVLALVGLLGLIAVLLMAVSGRIVSRVAPPTSRGGIYAETFAIWLILFFGLMLVAGALSGGQGDLALGVIPFGGSLLALAWPVQRGIPWSQVRRDIGLHWGTNPPFEPVAGVACYVMAIPLVAVGIILMLMLVYFGAAVSGDDANPFVSPSVPSHPVVEPLAFGDWDSRIIILLLAAVVAPVVEEIMFRGVLYRHLRDATGQAAGSPLSIVISGTVTGLIFAVLHPQGLVTVPILMALAYGFTIGREWRGSLVPCMVAHGLSNALVALLVLAAIGE